MKAVLLDRDGVINALVYHEEASVIDAPFTTAQFRLLPRVPEAIRLLNDAGLKIAVVSNQPGLGKGHLRPDTLEEFGRAMREGIAARGGEIHGVYYCPHHPEAKLLEYRRQCHCRKPSTGLLEQAAMDLGVALQECYAVGDGITDLLAGERAGCRTIFIGRWKCEICQFVDSPHVRPAFVARDLWEAAQFIRSEVAVRSETPLPRFTT